MREIRESYSWEDVPPYGEVRTLIQQIVENGSPVGNPISVFDLTYQPELPEGAVRGEPTKCAPFCNYCNPPKYFYLDQALCCSECDADFVFTALEQKHWFEVLQVHIRTRCIRCKSCRRSRWTRKSAQKKLQIALTELESDVSNELLHLNVAQAIVDHFECCSEGNLEKAIHHARQARAKSALYPESHYWEAKAQALCGRRPKAKLGFYAFLESSKGCSHLEELRARARELLSL